MLVTEVVKEDLMAFKCVIIFKNFHKKSCFHLIFMLYSQKLQTTAVSGRTKN